MRARSALLAPLVALLFAFALIRPSIAGAETADAGGADGPREPPALEAPAAETAPVESAPSPPVAAASTPAVPSAPSAPAAPSASRAVSSASSGSAVLASYDVRLHERIVFTLHAARAGQSGLARARAATAALEKVLDDPDQPEGRLEEPPGSAVVFVGKTPIVTLGDEDAEAAGGDVTLHVFASTITSKVDEGLRLERRRSAISQRVLRVSMVVLAALLAFLLYRRAGELAGQTRAWVRDHPDRVPALRLGRIEVVGPIAVRGALSLALALAHRLAQFGIVYLWLIFALSCFDATRAYTDRLAGFVLAPLSALIGRLGASLPLVVVAGITAVALGVAVRFVGLFFVGVERGETHLNWLPRELAGPTSVLVRAGMVLASIVLAAPLITGTDDGALSRAGVVALAALGVACTPLLACAAAGVPAVFGRRFRPGDFVEAGGRIGIVREVTLLELVLEDPFGCQVRVPQLLGLWHPSRVLGSAPLSTIDVVVDPQEPAAHIEEALVSAVHATCDRARVELVSLDADGARWRISGVPKRTKGAASLADAVGRAIRERGIALGRATRGLSSTKDPT